VRDLLEDVAQCARYGVTAEERQWLRQLSALGGGPATAQEAINVLLTLRGTTGRR
jgi:hypothetical protein